MIRGGVMPALTKVTRAKKKMAGLANMMKEVFGQRGERSDCGDGEIWCTMENFMSPRHDICQPPLGFFLSLPSRRKSAPKSLRGAF